MHRTSSLLPRRRVRRQAHPARAAHPPRQAHQIRRGLPREAATAAALAVVLASVSVAIALPIQARAPGAPTAITHPSPALVTVDPGTLQGAAAPAPRTMAADATAPACLVTPAATLPSPAQAESDPGSSNETFVRGDRPVGGPILPAASGDRPVRAVVLGDSLTTGWNGAGTGRKGWFSIVARELGWRPRNLAVAGTGFVNPGWTGQPVRTRIAAVVAMRPQVVVLATGHNDGRYGAAASGRAAAEVVARLRRELPDALLVVVGPIWHTARPPAAILGLRDRLRRAAKAAGAVWIDPIRDGWFAGASRRFIGADGLHPTNAGHRHMARQVLAALRRAAAPTRVMTTRVEGPRTSPARVPIMPHVPDLRRGAACTG